MDTIDMVSKIVDLAVSSGCMIEIEGVKVTPVPSMQKREHAKTADNPAPERKPQRQPGHHPIQDLQGLANG